MTYKELIEEIEALANAVVEECNADEELYNDYLHELIDNHEWIIYTSSSWELVYLSRTTDYALYESGCSEFDDMGLECSNPVDRTMTQMAYCVLYAAVHNKLYEMYEA